MAAVEGVSDMDEVGLNFVVSSSDEIELKQRILDLVDVSKRFQ